MNQSHLLALREEDDPFLTSLQSRLAIPQTVLSYSDTESLWSQSGHGSSPCLSCFPHGNHFRLDMGWKQRIYGVVLYVFKTRPGHNIDCCPSCSASSSDVAGILYMRGFQSAYQIPLPTSISFSQRPLALERTEHNSSGSKIISVLFSCGVGCCGSPLPSRRVVFDTREYEKLEELWPDILP